MLDRIAERGEPADRECEGTAPVTDYESKSVMLRAERNDRLQIVELVTQFTTEYSVPTECSVLRRSDTYFGPTLLLHAEHRGRDVNLRLTAPGPDTYLYLWQGVTDDDGFRTHWKKLAEVKAVLLADQPQYEFCAECGEPIQTLEHEQAAAFGRCPAVDS